ncbi:MAG: alcohol dehydrogenase catalytic domain-containing protein [Maritimibacter sp.]
METNCILVSEIGRFEWARKLLRQFRADEVLVRVEVTGLCRTDLKIIRHGHRDLVLPRIPGEEVVGRIVAKGAAVAGFEIDDRVYAYPGIWCGRCPACTQGAENLCRGMQIMGFHRDGGFADYVIAPAKSLISVPDVVVAIFLVAIFGPGFATLIASLAVVGWTPFARLSRGLTLTINTQGYVRAAEVLGCSRSFIVFRHVIPNIIRPVAAVTFVRFGHNLIMVGALSFLGLGVQPPAPDWALMLADAQPYVERLPILMLAPGLAIFLAALSVTWIGHGLGIEAKEKGSTDE